VESAGSSKNLGEVACHLSTQVVNGESYRSGRVAKAFYWVGARNEARVEVRQEESDCW